MTIEIINNEKQHFLLGVSLDNCFFQNDGSGITLPVIQFGVKEGGTFLFKDSKEFLDHKFKLGDVFNITTTESTKGQLTNVNFQKLTSGNTEINANCNQCGSQVLYMNDHFYCCNRDLCSGTSLSPIIILLLNMLPLQQRTPTVRTKLMQCLKSFWSGAYISIDNSFEFEYFFINGDIESDVFNNKMLERHGKDYDVFEEVISKLLKAKECEHYQKRLFWDVVNLPKFDADINLDPNLVLIDHGTDTRLAGRLEQLNDPMLTRIITDNLTYLQLWLKIFKQLFSKTEIDWT